MKLTAVQKNDIVRRVRACRYQTQAEALHAAVQLAEEALAVAHPAGEPARWIADGGKGETYISRDAIPSSDLPPAKLPPVPLYTTPPAAARVPLTNEQIAKLLDSSRMSWSSRSGPPTYEFAPAFARAIERAHGITGGAA